MNIMAAPQDQKKLEPDAKAWEVDTLFDPAKPYRCRACGSRFQVRWNLVKHLHLKKDELADSKKGASCRSSPLWGKALKVAGDLTNDVALAPGHTQESREARMLYKCRSCGEQFSAMGAFRSHLGVGYGAGKIAKNLRADCKRKYLANGINPSDYEGTKLVAATTGVKLPMFD